MPYSKYFEAKPKINKITNLLATAGNLEGIQQMISKFYGGEKKELRQVNDNEWSIHNPDGKTLQTRVTLEKGRYKFGV
jgi:hypothetical protein